MKLRNRVLWGLALAVPALVAAPVPAASAKTKKIEDAYRGFELRIEDSFEQVPPKPGTDDLHIAAEFKDPSPKYRRFSGDQPTFRVTWCVRPKDGAPVEEAPLPPWAQELSPEQQEMVRRMMADTPKDLDSEIDGTLQRLEFLFGPFKAMKDRWADEAASKHPKVIETDTGEAVSVVEVNYSKKRPKEGDATWWLWAGKASVERENATIELGFYGYVDVQFADDFRKQFEAVVKSFKVTEPEKPDFVGDANDPEEQKIAKFIQEKVIKGWSTKRTPHYLIVYDDDVKKDLIKRVASEIEALRAQVYEVIFPPDRPVKAISIVRVCETRDQYMAYGAPGGSAGYWSPYHEELVLYQDRNDKKDAVRVLYHEAFHQYIYYSVGEVSPHSWFNEGHGDFFSGHVYKRGKFNLDVFSWRTGEAQEWKAKWEKGIFKKSKPGPGETSDGGQRLTLKEWLTWSQGQYYGNNEYGIPGGSNYALGWSFIYFLRTTKNPDYQRILPTYFNTLKSFVTQDREAREKALGGALGGEPEPGEGGAPAPEGGGPAPEGGDPTAGGDAPRSGETSDALSRGEWHGASVDEAFRGIDLAKLEKDWLDHRW